MLKLCSHVRQLSTLRNTAIEKLKILGNGKVHLEFDETSQIANIILDNPEKKNALSGSMMVQLEEAVSKLEKWDTGKGIILKSVGNVFCSGGDLDTVKGIFNENDGRLMCEFMQNVTTRLYSLPLITVCLVQGRAIGGGAELITCTDFRVFTPDAKIQFVQAIMGVSTGWGGGTRLSKLLGFRKALDLLVTCNAVHSEQAVLMGLSDDTIDNNNRDLECTKWLSRRIKHEFEVIHAIKKTVIGSRDLGIEDSLSNECDNFAPLWGGKAQQNAINSKIKH